MLELKSVFSDNALFEADSPLEIKGRTKNNTEVFLSLKLSGRVITSAKTVSDPEGFFSLVFHTPGASFDAYEIEVRAFSDKEESITLRNILFGELWLSVGQSNMEMQNHYMDGCEAMYDSLSKKSIRIYLQDWMGDKTLNREEFAKKQPFAKNVVTNWMDEFAADPEMSREPVYDTKGVWLTCSGEEIMKLERASAVASSAIEEMYAKINEASGKNIPFGFLNCAIGGTDCEAWIPASDAKKSDKLIELLELNGKTYDPKRWNDNSTESFNQPSCLFNLKIAPITGLKISGVMWYQGENNIRCQKTYETYYEAIKCLFSSYRRIFAADDSFVFIASQINPFVYFEGRCGVFSINRAICDMARNNPGSFITVTNYDLPATWAQGRNHPLHPSHKYALGKRFASAILAARYGFPGLSSAVYALTFRFENGAAYVSFSNGAFPLELKSSFGFRIAGKNGVYYDADAELADFDTIKLSSPSVTNPVKCVYGCCDMDWYPSLSSGGMAVIPFSSEDSDPMVQCHPWLFPEISSYNVVSYTEYGPDLYMRPVWHPEKNSELCIDTSYYENALRFRGEDSTCGGFAVSSACQRLDLHKYSGISFEISYPSPVRCFVILDFRDKSGSEYSLTYPCNFVKNISFNRDLVKADIPLSDDTDEMTVSRIHLAFENINKNQTMCTVCVGNLRLI